MRLRAQDMVLFCHDCGIGRDRGDGLDDGFFETDVIDN